MEISRLKELLSYDPRTGLFVRLTSRGGSCAGAVAGWRTAKGAVGLTIEGRKYLAHRVAWFYIKGEWPAYEIDHRDGDPSNNRFKNLRAATHAQNTRNTKLQKNSTSGVKGVDWHMGKWRATITFDGHRVHLGRFTDISAASAAYAEASRKYHGDFGRLG